MSNSSESISKTTGAKKREKIAVKTIQKLAVVAIVANVLLIILVGNLAERYMAEKQENYLGEIASNISNTIATNLEEYMAIANTVALNLDVIELLELSDKTSLMNQQETSADISKYLTNVDSSLPAIVNIGLCDIEQDAYFLQDGTISDSSFSFKTRDYYEVVNTKKSMITDPYVDVVTNEIIISVVTPVLDNQGNALGCVVVDVSLDFILNLTLAAGFGETGKSLITDTKGILIACMDTEFVGTSYTNLGVSGDELEREMANTTGVLVEMKASGIDALGKVSAIGDTGWVLVSSMDEHEFNADANNLRRSLSVLLFLSSLVNLIVTAYAVQKSIKPIEYIRKAMHELALGNIKYKLDYESNNEIGDLADDLHAITANLSVYIDEITNQLTACSKGDFTVKSDVEFLGDFSVIESSINEFTDLISESLYYIKETVEQVSIESNTVATGSQSLAEGSIRQSESVSNLTDLLSNITDQIKGSSTIISGVNKTAQGISIQLDNNNHNMDEMMSAMANIQEKSDSITKIVKTIEDVAFQTNILALNAAVEAARAGVAGKGFAVVADEVRNLATRTSEAVKNTSTLIEDSTNAVNHGNDIVQNTIENLKTITEDISGFVSTLDEITNNSKEQTIAIEHVNVSIIEISDVTNSNSAVSEESASTSEELSNQANKMKDSIDKFRLK